MTSGSIQQESEGFILPLQPEAAQRRASDPAYSAWVGASAGSGKTKVLVDRVIRLLLSGVRPERILCLTFTRAAAAEMSIRVMQQLLKWAACEDDLLRHDLDAMQGHSPAPEQIEDARRLFARVLGCPGGMRIHTIHAFCQEILRRFPLEAGLPPHFSLIEEAEAQALQSEAQSYVLKKAASFPESPEGKALRTLARDIGETNFSRVLREMTEDSDRLEAALAKAGNAGKLIAFMRGLLELEPGDTEDSVKERAFHNESFAYDEIKRIARLIHDQGTKKFAARAKEMLDWLDLPLHKRVEKMDSYLKAFFKNNGDPLEEFANKDLLEKNPEIAPSLAREIARLRCVLERSESARTAEQTGAFITLASAFSRRYTELKNSQSLLDYSDLITRAETLLYRPGIAPWVLFKLDGGIDHVLVDEAQDTSPAQWRIIKALTEEFFSGLGAHGERTRTVFVVGDEKQSIYSFLKADPEEFHRMREYFQKRVSDAGRECCEVPINVSFRSAPAVLRAVDAVFANEASCRGVSRSPVRHEAWRREAAGRVEVWPLIPARKKEKSEWELPLTYEKDRDPVAELAARIAEWIKKRRHDCTMVFDRKLSRSRPLEYSDVMVLVRKRKPFAEQLVRALKERGIPVTGADRMVLIEQLAVMDLLALLQFTLLPDDDLNLATVLRGPLLGLSEEQLMHIAIGREKSLWQSLKDKAQNDCDLARAHDYLERFLALADEITAFSMLARILNEPCPADGISGRRAVWKRLGPDALDPIDELLNAACKFGAQHTPSLQAFLHWLKAAQEEIKREMDPGAGQVRIATVHAAKGLEAPVVILPDSVSVPRKQDLPKILWHRESGVPFYVPREPDNSMLERLREESLRKQLEEHRRLLYVAMTRAMDWLIVCGWEPQRKENFENSWYNLIYSALKPLHQSSAARKYEDFSPDIVLDDSEFYALSPSPAAEVETAPESGLPPLPSWARQEPRPEPKPPRPLAPSRPEKDEPSLINPADPRFLRGRAIHRLLQSLPEIEDAQREEAAVRFLGDPLFGLGLEQREEISREVLAILRNPDFAPLFGPSSRAEVPITGLAGDRIVSGQIDRLCVLDNEVWIVDYKTNRLPPPDASGIPPVYLDQLSAYCSVLKEIYPSKKVRGFLLWSCGPRLMPVPQRLLHIEKRC